MLRICAGIVGVEKSVHTAGRRCRMGGMNEVTDGSNHRHGSQNPRLQSKAPGPKGGGEKIVTHQKEGTTNDPREKGSHLGAGTITSAGRGAHGEKRGV